jgi:LAO/AO transport system kinase
MSEPATGDGAPEEREDAASGTESTGSPGDGDGDDRPELVERLLAGEHRALARSITRIENRSPGYRELVSALYPHAGDARVIGVTGSPGAGKSTLVDKLARAYRDRGLTVGVIAVDPSSPYSGGAVLGDRIRMGSTVGDMDVFVRSMSARGQLGGLSTATADAVVALDAFGKDRVIVETVGAGQNEVDVVRTADTVAVLVQPGSGDDVQMLKAGILEIGDVFVVNKADHDGAARTVAELEEMVHAGQGRSGRVGHHGTDAGTDRDHHGTDAGTDGATDGRDGVGGGEDDGAWTPPVVETVATTGRGVEELLAALDDHHERLVRTGAIAERARERYAAEIRRLLRNDVAALVDDELARRGGVDELAAAVDRHETDPYAIADELLAPIRDCVADHRDEPDADDEP